MADTELDLTSEPLPASGGLPVTIVPFSPADTERDYTSDPPPLVGGGPPSATVQTVPWSPTRDREEVRGVLARGLLWLLTFAVGGVMAFIGLGLLDGTVLTQSVFPSLVALAGTALGFYFGSQTVQGADSSTTNPGVPTQPAK